MPIVGGLGSTTLSIETFPASGIYTDLTDYLLQASLTLKFNTLDFALKNAPLGVVALTSGVKVKDPAWTGNVASLLTSDFTDLRTGDVIYTIAATNTKVLPADTAPFDLSDEDTTAPFQLALEDGTGHMTAEDGTTILDTESSDDVTNFLLEDASGHYLLENGTDWSDGSGYSDTGALALLLTEGYLSRAYSALSVQKRVNTTAGGPPLTLGRARVYKPGLRVGNVFKLTSLNQLYTGASFSISQLTARWPGLSNFPVFDIEFGDTPQTLAAWATLTAPGPAPVSAPPVVVPSGPVIFGKLTATPGIYPQGGGIVTVGSATFSVSVAAGHTMSVQFVGAVDVGAYAWDNYVAVPRRAVRGVIDGGIYTGAWQETPFGIQGQVSHAVYDLSSAPGIALASGTYTISIQIISTEFNQLQVFNGWAQAAVTTV